MKVRSLIKREPITIRPTSTLGEAALLMRNQKIGCLPVLDDTGALVGIITKTDLLAILVEELKARRSVEPSSVAA